MKHPFEAQKIKTLSYHRPIIERGYANQTLYVDLSHEAISIKPVSNTMKSTFVGGKGFDLWLLWQAVSPTTRWSDPENEICIASGPLGGTPGYPGAGKSIVTTLSPLTGSVIDSNVGGYFGPYLKFCGFDALEIQGISNSGEVVILIDGIDEKIEIYTVKGLSDYSGEITEILTEFWGKDNPKSVSVVSSGIGARHTRLGILNFSWYDPKRKKARYKQAARGGVGTVFAHKGVKAIVARWDSVRVEMNHPADLSSLRKVARGHAKEIVALDPKQNEMSTVGTAHLVDIMNEFDLLPTKNYQYGSHPEALNLGHAIFQRLFDPGFDGCWMGCTVSCAHCVREFVPLTGPYKGQKVFVDGPEYETLAGCGSNLGIFDPHTVLEMNFYCDTYGLDTISVGTGIAFAMECFERGLIDSSHTGGLDLSFGNRASALELVHQMAEGRGFGKIVGQGIRRMKEIFAEEFGTNREILEDIGMEAKGLEFSEYVTKESLAQQGGYGLALKGPQHDEAWLIFLDMVENLMPSFEQKAEALHWFPMFRTWFGLCGLCKLPWNDIVPEDNADTDEPAKVMKHVQWYAQFFSSVTGQQVSTDDLIRMSEGVYNFQRIFNLRMGYGRREHDKIPYRAMGPVTVEEYMSRQERYDTQLREEYGLDISGMSTKEKLRRLREFRTDKYEKLMDAVYRRRGWSREGIPTLETVKRLGIDFEEILDVLAKV